MISQPVSSIFSPSVLHCPLALCELQAWPFPDVVFPPLPLSAWSSPPFRCALQDGFGQTCWTGDMSIPLQFASLYDGQELVSRCFERSQPQRITSGRRWSGGLRVVHLPERPCHRTFAAKQTEGIDWLYCAVTENHVFRRPLSRSLEKRPQLWVRH